MSSSTKKNGGPPVTPLAEPKPPAETPAPSTHDFEPTLHDQVTGPPKSGHIYGAILAVMKHVEAVGKDQLAKTTGGDAGFKFRGIDDMYNELHAKLAEHGVFTVPTVLKYSRQQAPTRSGGIRIFTIALIRYTFYAADGSFLTAVTLGEGADSGDKSATKSMAIAHKYALVQTFAIPTQDNSDPDHDVHDDLVGAPSSSSRRPPTPAPAPARPAPNPPAPRPAAGHPGNPPRLQGKQQPRPGPDDLQGKRGVPVNSPQAPAPAAAAKPPAPAKKPAAAKPPAKPKLKPKFLTEAQLKRLYTVADARGWTGDQVKEYMMAAWSLASSIDLNRSQYDMLIQMIEQYAFETAIAEFTSYDPNFDQPESPEERNIP